MRLKELKKKNLREKIGINGRNKKGKDAWFCKRRNSKEKERTESLKELKKKKNLIEKMEERKGEEIYGLVKKKL